MIKQLAVVLLLAAVLVVNAQNECSANISGPNNATPGRRAKRTSASCSANISGPNNASPAKRQSTVCSGNGVCDGDTCVCNAGWEGDECQTACIESTTAAPTDAPTTVAPTDAPTTAAPTAAPSTAAPTDAPTTAAPTTEAPTNPPVQQTPAPTSASCAGADISGPNQASPAKRQSAVCSGNGQCNGQVCQCAPGFSGSECEIAPPAQATPAPTSASCAGADISGPNQASPAKRFLNLFKRQTTVCSGNGQCNGQVCQCAPGFSGSECEIAPTVQATPAPSSAAPTPSDAPSGSPSDAPSSAAPTPGPTEEISGENNARASSATTIAVSGFAVIVAAVAMCL